MPLASNDAWRPSWCGHVNCQQLKQAQQLVFWEERDARYFALSDRAVHKGLLEMSQDSVQSLLSLLQQSQPVLHSKATASFKQGLVERRGVSLVGLVLQCSHSLLDSLLP